MKLQNKKQNDHRFSDVSMLVGLIFHTVPTKKRHVAIGRLAGEGRLGSCLVKFGGLVEGVFSGVGGGCQSILGQEMSHEKNPPTFHYIGWLIGILIMVYDNPHING